MPSYAPCSSVFHRACWQRVGSAFFVSLSIPPHINTFSYMWLCVAPSLFHCMCRDRSSASTSRLSSARTSSSGRASSAPRASRLHPSTSSRTTSRAGAAPTRRVSSKPAPAGSSASGLRKVAVGTRKAAASTAASGKSRLGKQRSSVDSLLKSRDSLRAQLGLTGKG